MGETAERVGVREECEALRRDGYVVIPNALPPARVAELRGSVAAVLEGHPFGRNPFEGERTERVYALLAKCESAAQLVEDSRILAICDEFLTTPCLLSSIQAVNIHPGEVAQALHCDDDAGAPPRPRAPQGISTMWALGAFTAAGGATRLVPKSHLWGADRNIGPDDPISLEMAAGSVLVYLGGVFHGGGAHTASEPRLGISVIYCQPWLRQFENQVLSVPPVVAARFSNRLQRLLGYSQLGPLGTVDGRDPIRLIEAERARSSEVTNRS